MRRDENFILVPANYQAFVERHHYDPLREPPAAPPRKEKLLACKAMKADATLCGKRTDGDYCGYHNRMMRQGQ